MGGPHGFTPRPKTQRHHGLIAQVSLLFKRDLFLKEKKSLVVVGTVENGRNHLKPLLRQRDFEKMVEEIVAETGLEIPFSTVSQAWGKKFEVNASNFPHPSLPSRV